MQLGLLDYLFKSLLFNLVWRLGFPENSIINSIHFTNKVTLYTTILSYNYFIIVTCLDQYLISFYFFQQQLIETPTSTLCDNYSQTSFHIKNDKNTMHEEKKYNLELADMTPFGYFFFKKKLILYKVFFVIFYINKIKRREENCSLGVPGKFSFPLLYTSKNSSNVWLYYF
jgi:hypothetical protein